MQPGNPLVRMLMRIVGFLSLGTGIVLLFMQITSHKSGAGPAATAVVEKPPVARPSPKVVRKKSPKPPTPLSTIKLTGVHPEIGFRRFDIQLKKQDGWFDTGIPVTAGTALLVWNRNIRERTFQAMIGDVVLSPQGKNNQICVYTSTDQDDLKKNGPDYYEQYMIMPPNVLRTLKIRILPDISDDGDYVVKVSTSHFQATPPGPLTPSQEREEAALVKWNQQ